MAEIHAAEVRARNEVVEGEYFKALNKKLFDQSTPIDDYLVLLREWNDLASDGLGRGIEEGDLSDIVRLREDILTYPAMLSPTKPAKKYPDVHDVRPPDNFALLPLGTRVSIGIYTRKKEIPEPRVYIVKPGYDEYAYENTSISIDPDGIGKRLVIGVDAITKRVSDVLYETRLDRGINDENIGDLFRNRTSLLKIMLDINLLHGGGVLGMLT